VRITPLDIQKQQFRLRFRGFDVREVDAFLEAVAEEFKELVGENEALRAEVHRLEEQLSDYRGRERALQETLVRAQEMSENLKEEGRRGADLVIGEAKLAAEKILAEAHQRLARLHDDLNELKRQYVQFETKIRSAVEAHLKLLDLDHEEAPAEGLLKERLLGGDRHQA
jgi:cell division initiation protein